MKFELSKHTSGTSAHRHIVLDENGAVVTAKAGRYVGNQYSHNYRPSDEETRIDLAITRQFLSEGKTVVSVPNGPDWEHVRFEVK